MTRITETRVFGPTLDTNRLPVLGEARAQVRRAQTWHRLIVALLGFWAVAATLLIITLI